MSEREPESFLARLRGVVVVLDLASQYVCLGTLENFDESFLELVEADLHDLRDSRATRETYVFDSQRLGIRRNRNRVLIRRDEVVALTRLEEILES